MESIGILIFFAVIFLLASPILAIIAILRTNKPQPSGDQLAPLLQRLSTLEKRVAELQSRPATPPAATVPPPAAPQAAPQSAPPPAAAPHAVPPAVHAAPPLPSARGKDSASSALDLETLIAGRWLNRIGILAVLLSVSFFLKYAFENNWIGPTGRIAIGLLLGSAMLPWSGWLLERGYSYFSEGIAGLGEAILYVSLWAGWHYYDLFSQTTAFAAMIGVTALMAAVALGRNSQRIALLSLLGGFLTPLIVSTGKNQEAILFTYLLILGAGQLIIAIRRNWRFLIPISFLFTQVYFWGWYESFYAPQFLERTVAFAALFFLLYSAGPVLRACRPGDLFGEDSLLILGNAGAILIALYAMLWPDYRWAMTLAVLILSAGLLAVTQQILSSGKAPTSYARLLFAGLALSFATLAIPIRLEGRWITMSFSIEGAILVWSGFRASVPLLRRAGYFLMAAAAFRLLFFPIPAPRFLFNASFAAYLVLAAALAFSLAAARRVWDSLDGVEKGWLGMQAVAINALLVLALSQEFWGHFARIEMHGSDRLLSQHLALTVLWISYASALLLVGMMKQSPLLRWQALALFGLAVTKAFFYDLSFLDRFYRILSFFFLGFVLLAVSFFYQRKIARERSNQ
ncbi:MAG: DUF2339 domain-containing protein [Acidobacteriia bacterium]|nr:DUF2339 domain-containing protein [Terriglobia bacterium]